MEKDSSSKSGKTGKVPKANRDRIIRVEFYHDPDITEASAFDRFLDRVTGSLLRSIEKGNVRSVGLDSVTWASLSGRKYSQYTANPEWKDPRKWHAEETDFMEEALMLQLAQYPCNVGAAFHVSKEKIEAEGSMVRAPLAKGRLLNMVGAAWPELYHLYVDFDDKGNRRRILQTDADAKWQAATQIELPDETRVRKDPTEVWKEMVRLAAKVGEENLHVGVYGEPGCGKSHFLSGMPTPMVVCFFDAKGKHMPYYKRGEVGEPMIDKAGTHYREVVCPPWAKKEAA